VLKLAFHLKRSVSNCVMCFLTKAYKKTGKSIEEHIDTWKNSVKISNQYK
jgi:hypothetical protein